MKVKDLIRDTVWMPGSDYVEGVKPKVSVLLPTFRRGKSGLFRRAVESVLEQSLTDIELIIVDDASTDGTAEQIQEFMEKDGRVSCLRHPKNIGLPAISEYEAYVRARAELISFAFDDTFFHPDALEKLVAEARKYPWAVVYGHVEWLLKNPVSGDSTVMRLGSDRSQGTLRTGNYIPNNGVLLPKRIVEDVGFYDPHIVVARVCDWDLWRRIAERYELRFVDVAVGREDGPITTDSLGNTYSLDVWAADEWMSTARNERLRPENLPNCEVLAPDSSHGNSSRTICESLAVKHAAARGWELNVTPQTNTQEADGYVLVVNLHYDASTALYFDLLPQSYAKRVRVVSFNGGFGVEELARATCVIFVRHIRAFRPWVDAAKAINLPIYYFLDDNLPLLADTGEDKSHGEDFHGHVIREDLKSFDGVLLSSPLLERYFCDHLLHSNILQYPVACAEQMPLYVDHKEKKNSGEVVIAFAGGSHRAKGLWDIILPGIKKLAADGIAIHFVIPETNDDKYLALLDKLPDNLRVTMLSFEPGYVFAMRRFARYQPDYVLHAPSNTVNNPFKTLHPLLTAHLLNAVPVLPHAEPYSALSEDGAAILVEDPFVPLSWYKKLSDLISGDCDGDEVKRRNAQYCADHFSAKENGRVLDQLCRKHGGEVSWPEQSRRLHRMTAWVRSTAGLPSGISNSAQASNNANELAALRRMTRYSWRHRILRGNTDLWDSVASEFSRLKDYSSKAGWRSHRSSLELSDALHDVAFREYQVKPPSGEWAGLSVAVAVDWVRHGLIGVELVSPDESIADNVSLDLSTLDISVPVRFAFTGVKVKPGEVWRVRVYARTTTPVYIYEFVNRTLLGLRFSTPTPFMELFFNDGLAGG